ncbi:hypothetical protein [Actinoplanes philippinensis]|uniref:hypothetical protein n=1 Tax=Actinoplanes philippinensis TaxID=35752 RepID=UPI001160425B|nr:hypothetical protein [Actinoplanes philippinensis]
MSPAQGSPSPGGEQPVAGRRVDTPSRGKRLIGRATIARLRGGPPARTPAAPEPVVIIQEQQVLKPWRLWFFTGMLVSLTVGVLLGQAEAYRANPPRVLPTVVEGPPSAGPSVAPLTAPLGTARRRTLEITGATTTLRIRTAAMGDQLYSILGLDPGIPPRITDTGAGSVLTLSPDAVVTGGAEVVLNSTVQWTVKLTGSANELDVDARPGGLATVESTSAVARGLLQLPKPKTSIPLKITGPVGDLTVRTEAGAPVRVRAAKGAGSATVAGKAQRDIKEGATLQETGWRTAQGRYDLRLTTRANSIVVERLTP